MLHIYIRLQLLLSHAAQFLSIIWSGSFPKLKEALVQQKMSTSGFRQISLLWDLFDLNQLDEYRYNLKPVHSMTSQKQYQNLIKIATVENTLYWWENSVLIYKNIELKIWILKDKMKNLLHRKSNRKSGDNREKDTVPCSQLVIISYHWSLIKLIFYPFPVVRDYTIIF